ncbi:MAG: tetratricopeptide repeat protein [Deltaproteobacteria bacterium]|nr:tetratricopeptide repeat protein [Deltaproteobacteria bacterium]
MRATIIMPSRIITFVVCGWIISALIAGCVSLPEKRPFVSYPPAQEEYSGEAAYHYSLAVLMRLDGDLKGAIDQMKQALTIQPDSPYLTTELVSLYVENNNSDLALSVGESALVRQPGNIELRSILGGLYFTMHQYDKAVREYQTIVDMDPKNLVAYLYLATIYAQEKKYAQAQKAFQKMLAMDPDNIIGGYYYAKMLAEINRFAEAETLYQKIIQQRPAFETAWLGLAQLYEAQNKFDDAITVYRRYLDANPARVGFRMKIAELLVKVNKAPEAEKEFREILKVDPANREVRTALGLLYYDMRRFDEAVAEFSSLLAEAPEDDKLLYLLANALEQKGDTAKALAMYRKIAPAFELYANAQIHAAMILKKENRLAEAVSIITGAIGKKNDQVILYLYLSALYEDGKNMAAAEKIVREGIALFPSSTDLHYALGTILEKSNRFEESIRSMEKVLALDPQNADALNFIGYSYADRGMHLDQAEQMIVQALKIKPDNGYILDSLGWVYFKKNQYTKALKQLQRALELLPDDPNIMEHLGDVYSKIGESKKAVEYYRKAVKMDPQNRALQKKLDHLITEK